MQSIQTIQPPLTMPGSEEAAGDQGRQGTCWNRTARQLRYDEKVAARQSESAGLDTIILGMDEKTNRFILSQENYTNQKKKGLQDYKKALDPIAQTTWESIKSGAGSVLKTLRDWTIQVAKFVYRYTGLEFIVNAIKNKLSPVAAKVDLYQARSSASQAGRAAVMTEMKQMQSARGIAVTGSENNPFGQKRYNLDRIDHESDAVERDQKALAAIEDIERKRAAKEQEKISGYVAFRNDVEQTNARINRAMARSKYGNGGMAYSFSPEMTPAKTVKTEAAKVAMDAKMSERRFNRLMAEYYRDCDSVKGILKKPGTKKSGKSVTFKGDQPAPLQVDKKQFAEM